MNLFFSCLKFYIRVGCSEVQGEEEDSADTKRPANLVLTVQKNKITRLRSLLVISS